VGLYVVVVTLKLRNLTSNHSLAVQDTSNFLLIVWFLIS